MSPRLRALLLLLLLASPWLASPASAAVHRFEEASLNVCRDETNFQATVDGSLLVNGCTSVYRISPDGSGYTAYQILSTYRVIAAPDGSLWWKLWGIGSSQFGRINPISDPSSSTATIQKWSYSKTGVTISMSGLAFDGQNRLWMTLDTPQISDQVADLYRFDPSATENNLCKYEWPGDTASYMILNQGADTFWLGDWPDHRMIRISLSAPDEISIDAWVLSFGGTQESSITGLALDESGRLWWSDHSRGVIESAVFDTHDVTADSYPLPEGGMPGAIVYDQGKIWYVDTPFMKIGTLDPSLAENKTSVTLTYEGPLSPTFSCETLTATNPPPITVQTGSLSWSPQNIAPGTPAPGWGGYTLPFTPAGLGLSSGRR